MGKYQSQLKLLNTRRGFTIVELVIVIIVIGILAAITVVGYGTWRSGITEKAIKSDMQAFSAAMESARTFGNVYPTTAPSSFEPSDGVTISFQAGSNSEWYCAVGTGTTTSKQFYYDSVTKTGPVEGSCPIARDNLIKNPNPTNSANYVSSSTSALNVALTTNTDGEPVARSTRLTTAASALYVERASGGVATAQAGDTYTILYTITASVNTSLTSHVGYGTGTATIAALDRPLSLVANTPTLVRQQVTIPSGFNGQPIFIKILWPASGSPINSYFDVSEVMWTEGAYSGDYADGNSPYWSWSGTTNGSTSTGRS